MPSRAPDNAEAAAKRAPVPDQPSETSPSSAKANVLVVDDDPLLRRTVMRRLTTGGFNALGAETGEQGLEVLEQQSVDVVLLDVDLPGIDGLETLDRVRQSFPSVEVVILTGHADLRMSVDAIRRGAHDFLAKPFQSKDLLTAVERARDHGRLIAALDYSPKHVSMPSVVGDSPVMRSVCRLALDVAPTSVSVLILGETGTGKEVIARALHDASPRANRAFVPANCSAIPQELVESELFGHEKGAFTGATKSRPGLFQQAHGGTLFLDEIGDLPMLGQAKLLRALQSGEVRPVGADESRKCDVRVLAATNADLTRKIAEHKFRQDLYYRLNVVVIEMPSLAQRKDDIPTLVKHFVSKHSKRLGVEERPFSNDALWKLMQYDWPGNVRQLENVVERALVVSRTSKIGVKDLILQSSVPKSTASATAEQSDRQSKADELYSMPFAEAKKAAVREFEARYVSRVLEECNGNISEAARRSGLDRTNFRRILRRSKD